MRYWILAAAIASGTTQAADFSAVPSGTYEVDPTHAYLTFSYDHLGFSKPILSFDDFDLSLELDTAAPANSSVSATVDVSSVDAGSDIWYEHLMGEKFFDVANNPEAQFRSTGIVANGEGYTLNGELTIKGQTAPLELDVMINAAKPHPFNGKPTVGLVATGVLNRSDFGLGLYTPNISDGVSIRLDAELIKP